MPLQMSKDIIAKLLGHGHYYKQLKKKRWEWHHIYLLKKTASHHKQATLSILLSVCVVYEASRKIRSVGRAIDHPGCMLYKIS